MSTLRDKVNEMYDHLGDLTDTQFRVQVLNALYVVADVLDHLSTPPQPTEAAEQPQNRLQGHVHVCSCRPAASNGPLMDGDPACPIHGHGTES